MEIYGPAQYRVVDMFLSRQNFPDGRLERGRDIRVILSAGLKVRRAAAFLAPGPRFILPYFPLLHVHLVAQHHKRKPFRIFHIRVIHELLLPSAEVLEALQVIHGEREQAAVGSSVEWCAQGLEALLASRVPNLKGDEASVHFQVPVEELDTDGVERLRCLRLIFGFGASFLIHLPFQNLINQTQ